jgi:molybdate transport repressor ModE-like protein
MNLGPQDWNLIGAYLAVLRHGSLSAAARALGLSQPTVRRQIEALEKVAGATLFTRDTGGLTPVGGAAGLHALAETMETAALAFVRSAQDQATVAAGVVRLSCPAVFAVERLPPVFAQLQADHPALVVEMAVTNRVENILRHEADVAIRLVAPDQDRIVAQKVAAVELGLYAAPGPVADRMARMDWATFCTTGPFIGDDRRDVLARGFRVAGVAVPQAMALRTDDDLAQLAAIRAGQGVGVCQAVIAQRAGLVRLFPAITAKAEVWVIMHEDLRGVARVRALFDALVAALR